MAVVYPDDIKTARMNAVKNALGADGKLEIGTTGMATLIATVPLGSGGTVLAGVWTILSASASDPSSGVTGRANEARLRSSVNVDVVTAGLTVGSLLRQHLRGQETRPMLWTSSLPTGRISTSVLLLELRRRQADLREREAASQTVRRFGSIVL